MTISVLGAEISALGTAISERVQSFRQYRHGVSSDIGDCGVGRTPQICNRVTNHGDMGTFSKLGHELTANHRHTATVRSLQCYVNKTLAPLEELPSPNPLWTFSSRQSYSSLHSEQSLAWNHVRGDIDDPCGAIADFCRVIVHRRPRGRRSLRDSLNIIKHHETHVKHCDTS